jgi:hypothetical protein
LTQSHTLKTEGRVKMVWYHYIFIGIILGGLIFNKRMRDGFLNILGSLASRDKKKGGERDNYVNRNDDEPAGETLILRRRDGSEVEIDLDKVARSK